LATVNQNSSLNSSLGLSAKSQPANIQAKIGLHRSTLSSRYIQAHSERYLSHRLSGKSSNMSRRTIRYTLQKIKISTFLSAQQQQSHGDADDKAQLPLCITVLAIKLRSPKYTALQMLNPSMLLNTRTN